jgi:hypothetical protein
LKNEGREVKKVLLTDNRSAHSNTPQHLQQVKVTFLLPNHMSTFQPPDQRIIHTARTHYRTRLVRKMLANISVGCDENMNILEALQMLEKLGHHNSVKLLV